VAGPDVGTLGGAIGATGTTRGVAGFAPASLAASSRACDSTGTGMVMVGISSGVGAADGLAGSCATPNICSNSPGAAAGGAGERGGAGSATGSTGAGGPMIGGGPDGGAGVGTVGAGTGSDCS
jgi:hypothetical protein